MKYFLAVALLVPAAGAILTAAGSREVVLITPHSPEMVDVNRALWMKGEPVAEIYGIPHGRMKVLFPTVHRPAEDPSVALHAGSGFQEKTLWFLVKWITIAALAAAALSRAFASRP